MSQLIQTSMPGIALVVACSFVYLAVVFLTIHIWRNVDYVKIKNEAPSDHVQPSDSV